VFTCKLHKSVAATDDGRKLKNGGNKHQNNRGTIEQKGQTIGGGRRWTRGEKQKLRGEKNPIKYIQNGRYVMDVQRAFDSIAISHEKTTWENLER